MKINTNVSVDDVSELNVFNPVGECNWHNEFFNKLFPNSFLVCARELERNNLSGTQGFIEYKINYFGNKRIAFRSERTLLSASCRGKGVFKEQVDIGKAEIKKRGGLFCFGSTEALKPFKAAGFEVFEKNRIYDMHSFSMFKTFLMSFSLSIKYLSSQLIRIIQRKIEISDLFNFLIIRSFFSHVSFKNFFHLQHSTNRSKLNIKLTEFESDDSETTNGLSNCFNNRDDAVYLWLDADQFKRLSVNYPKLHHLKIECDIEGACHLILEKVHNGYFKIVMCSDYDFYYRFAKSHKKDFKDSGIFGLQSIRNIQRIKNRNEEKKEIGFYRLTGYGRLVFINFVDLAMTDLELEEIWLML